MYLLRMAAITSESSFKPSNPKFTLYLYSWYDTFSINSSCLIRTCIFPSPGPPSYSVLVKSPYCDDYMHVRPSHPAPSPPTKVTPPSQKRASIQPQPPQPPTMHQQVYPTLPESDGEGIPPYTGGQYPAPTYPQEVVDERTRLINQ